MATDPNILLQGIVPDLGAAISQGRAIARDIKEQPIRSQLLDLSLQQQDSIVTGKQQRLNQELCLVVKY